MDPLQELLMWIDQIVNQCKLSTEYGILGEMDAREAIADIVKYEHIVIFGELNARRCHYGKIK
jgi:hypothetical protein